MNNEYVRLDAEIHTRVKVLSATRNHVTIQMPNGDRATVPVGDSFVVRAGIDFNHRSR
jgi:hypothetical protein